MHRPPQNILLFRAVRENDGFTASFESAGWYVDAIPVLDFRFINGDRLKQTLQRAETYQGIILTSPRAGDLLAAAFEGNPQLSASWAGKMLVSTGARTTEGLVEFGFSIHYPDESGSKAVAHLVKTLPSLVPWLFLSGNLRRNELPAMLEEAGIAIQEINVYETLPAPDIELHARQTPDWAVFFSPSGFHAVRAVWPTQWHLVKIAAIGKTTAGAIEAAGWQVMAVAERPEPESLLAAVIGAMGAGDHVGTQS